MSLFDYLMVMVSIVLGLGVTQSLRGLAKIVRSPTRYLGVTLWAATVFLLHIQLWWGGMWDLNEVSTWTALSFTYVIAIPCTLFVVTELPLPHDENTGGRRGHRLQHSARFRGYRPGGTMLNSGGLKSSSWGT